ncbi:hypothetical protein HF086_009256 [Spodoptera exigua]|uniref:Reverse transcriptase domain-containing protein n=1 Tax=Spodoptera exigua TaxID=7107 RepID=A0A922MDC4_SPOEX|nr:hypothetical protein HF086_009256 [Spodoptera exigua]
METLNRQATIQEEMERQFTNFKKDGKDRKTVEYMKKRIEALDQYWIEFRKNHDVLLNVLASEHDYFIANNLERTRDFYYKARTEYQTTLAELEKASARAQQGGTGNIGEAKHEQGAGTHLGTTGNQQPSTSTHNPNLPQGNNTKIDEMLRKQSSNFRAFLRTLESIDVEELKEKWEYEDALTSVKARWKIVDNLHWELDSQLMGSNTEYEETFTQYERKYNDIKKAINSNKCKRDKTRQVHVAQQEEWHEILLATAVINVQGVDGTYHKMRALIDQGSQISLITENAAQRLGIPRVKCSGTITGIGTKTTSCKGRININCFSLSEDYTFNTDVFIMRNLTRNLPRFTFTSPTWEHLQDLDLADPEYNICRPIDILLGADIYSIIILDGIRRALSCNLSPIAQHTRLGWILCGKVQQTMQCNIVLNDIEGIEKFWQTEDIDLPQTTDEDNCTKTYKETTSRLSDGRYQVRLPLKPNISEIGESKSRAIAQFFQIERKLQKNRSIAEEYKLFIKEYLALGHMICTDGTTTSLEYFMPHHCVIREDSLTTALRVVFNASQNTSKGTSLNDFMFKGPNLQKDLLELILRWRQYKIAYTADIEKMFRQVWVHPDDQRFQKIIWRDDKSDVLHEYQLTTVTYGTKAAPFLAMMTLRQLAEDERKSFPAAAKVVENCFYTDDLLHGAHTIQSAKNMKQDLIQMLKTGGFNLRKWSSNYQELLQDNISRLFDPLGWLTPVSTRLKILFQKLWAIDIKWDDKIPDEINSEWIKIKQDMANITKIEIPRWIGTNIVADIELHGFCDASQKAYACVVYCKLYEEGKSKITLVAGKSRLVSNNKQVSLPRLELCGAHLLSKLMLKIKQCLHGHRISIYGWVDSTAVLGWLQGNPDRWTTFVSNRVRHIIEVIPPKHWRYIKSAENPADCASRGLTMTQLNTHQLWWHGPSWLSTGPHESKQAPIYTTNQEEKVLKQVNVANH